MVSYLAGEAKELAICGGGGGSMGEGPEVGENIMGGGPVAAAAGCEGVAAAVAAAGGGPLMAAVAGWDGGGWRGVEAL